MEGSQKGSTKQVAGGNQDYVCFESMESGGLGFLSCFVFNLEVFVS